MSVLRSCGVGVFLKTIIPLKRGGALCCSSPHYIHRSALVFIHSL